MARNTTRIQNLTLITADNVGDDDIIPLGPASGDRAKGVKVSELEKKFDGEGSPEIVQRFSAAGTINPETTLAISTGNNALEMPSESVVTLNFFFVVE